MSELAVELAVFFYSFFASQFYEPVMFTPVVWALASARCLLQVPLISLANLETTFEFFRNHMCGFDEKSL